jgi:hypothetical protein
MNILKFIRPHINGNPIGPPNAVDINFGGKNKVAGIDRRTALLVTHVIFERIAKKPVWIFYNDVMVNLIINSGVTDFRVDEIVAYHGVLTYRFAMCGAKHNPGEETSAIRIVRQVVNYDAVLTTTDCDAMMMPDKNNIVLDSPVDRRNIKVTNALRMTN